jgi:hypothetical protein
MDVLFTGTTPQYLFARDALSFSAIADGRPVRCVISVEALVSRFRARGFDEAAAREAFEANKKAIEDLARAEIERGGIREEVMVLAGGG